MENVKDLNLGLFDPQHDAETSLPDSPGNYIVVLRISSTLPDIGVEPVMKKIEIDGRQFDVIYTGISSKSLRKRDYGQHFTGNNAGRSMLRKSLGSMMGLKKIPRDRNNPNNGKTKFADADEEKLSKWMRENLLLLYCKVDGSKVETLEEQLIAELNPPLNLQKNYNSGNMAFRAKLSELRNKK